MVQYFHKFIKIIPQILKLLGIKTTKGRKLIDLSMELLWRLGYHYEAFNTQSRKKARRLAPRQRAYGLRPTKRAVRPLFGPSAQTNSNVKSRLYSLFNHLKIHPEAI